jgi:hypothetical protein
MGANWRGIPAKNQHEMGRQGREPRAPINGDLRVLPLWTRVVAYQVFAIVLGQAYVRIFLLAFTPPMASLRIQWT